MPIDITGITNENEFYTHHYLSVILEKDLKGVFKEWKRKEDEAGIPQPYVGIRGLRKEFFAMHSRLERERKTEDRLAMQRDFLAQLLFSLGYEYHYKLVELDNGAGIPLIGGINRADGSPELWIIEAMDVFGEGSDPLELNLFEEQYPADDEIGKILDTSLEKIVTHQVFGRKEPPRWVILTNNTQLLLLDRTKWHEKRLLRFDIREILDRRETSTLQAMAALLHRDSICPKDGMPLLDTLDENSHKHAFSVSEDLKYSLRKAIELLGNEAVWYLREKVHEKIYGRDMAEQLTRECLRYMYRMLFLFYIEARPELRYLPDKSEEYRKGYSLESLRDLEMIQLTTDESKNGFYLHESITLLFDLLYNGFQHKPKQLSTLGSLDHHIFRIAPLRSHLFDPKWTPLLNKVKFRNFVMQEIIELMSLSRPKKGKKNRRGRISYAQLGINQLGAVYEALLSYQGFFAETDLYEVKKAGEKHNVLETAYFVKTEDIDQYTEEERVYEEDGSLVKYEKGTFIYRLAGRDREKSASYYTPEVLTKCLVKYALKELLKDKTADEILALTVCEPAMGSAAFLNEAINQLAKAYLAKKQKEIHQDISHEDYPREQQKVKMYIADRNVHGVDLNPVAVELAEVSLWLNTIYEGAFVPWFGMQLVCGNSLIGARRQVFQSSLLEKERRDDTTWLDEVPERVMPGKERMNDTVYHFLLPDKGMADYKDKVVKKMAEEEIEKIKEWRKEFIKPYSKSEIEHLEKLSSAVDKLWKRHTKMQRDIDDRTTDPLHVFGQEKPKENLQLTTTEYKDRIYHQEMFSKNVRNSSPYRRLKLVMDYWCALWFWPIKEADLLPSRAEYLLDLTLVLEGNLYDAKQTDEAGQMQLFPDTRPKQMSLDMVDEFGFVNVDRLCRENARFGLVQELADKYRYLHWELEFGGLFESQGGFDLVLGNPPWTRVRLEAQKILSEYDPKVVIRKENAASVVKKMPTIFKTKINAKEDFIKEASWILASRNFMASAYYHMAGESNNNLYKCFIEAGYYLADSKGVIALLHDSGIYDEPKSNALRLLMTKHLTLSAIFVNQLHHFPEEALGHAGQFAITVLEKNKSRVLFDNIVNVFHPRTIDESFNQLDSGKKIPKIKNGQGWVLRGHPKRVINYDEERLRILNNNSREDALSAPLLALYAQPLVDLLIKKSKTETIKDSYPDLKGFPIIDETSGQKLNLIKRSIQRPPETSQFIMSAPHFYVGNPIFKQPNENCRSKGDYNSLSLQDIPGDFIPRAIFNLHSEDSIQHIISTEDLKELISDFRLAWRNWVSVSNERTLITTIIPPSVLHVNTTFSMKFPNYEDLLLFAGLSFSIVYDFFVRVTRIDHIWNENILNLPYPKDIKHHLKDEIIKRTLELTCITTYYKSLWETSQKNNTAWDKKKMRLFHKDRRNALVELDVLAAMVLEITLDDLLLLYTTQFPTLSSNENETYYDKNGRIVFTTNRGYSGIGFPRKASKTDPIGWEDIKDMRSGTVGRAIIDDTMPGGPVERTITYQAPFDRCNREKDYEVVWAEFERRFQATKHTGGAKG